MNSTNSKILSLAQQLIAKPSITPNDAGCQEILAEHLQKLGFTIQKLRFGDVNNLWAKCGNSAPLLVFVGHTDIVPPGPIEQWKSDPFKPEIRNENLYGRGAADMKSSIAAMIIACENFVSKYPNHKGSIAFLITSDEEGKAIDGTSKVVDHLLQQQEKIDYCLVGEASSEKQLGDTIKIGRRGTLNGKLLIHGKQGHIAYPQLADNPVHKSAAAIAELCQIHWDNGNQQFPPTSFQISNIHAGTGADNMIPGALEITFNFRFSPEITPEQLQQRVTNVLQNHQLNFQIDWRNSGKPFMTVTGELLKATTQAIEEILHITPKLSTAGGTSDGRFLAKTGCQIIELGPINSSIHQIDEHIKIADLIDLTKIYFRILELLLIK